MDDRLWSQGRGHWPLNQRSLSDSKQKSEGQGQWPQNLVLLRKWQAPDQGRGQWALNPILATCYENAIEAKILKVHDSLDWGVVPAEA